MAYRRTSSQLESWLRQRRALLISLGVSSGVLEAGVFEHDFLVHGEGVSKGLSRENCGRLLELLCEDFQDEVFELGVAITVVQALGPNLQLRILEGELLASSQFWFVTEYGRGPAYAFGGHLARLYRPEQAWIGLDFQAIGYHDGSLLAEGVVEKIAESFPLGN